MYALYSVCPLHVCFSHHPPGSSSPTSSCGATGNLVMSVEERRRHLASLPESMRRMSLDNSALGATMFRSRIPVWEREEVREGGQAQVSPIMEETNTDGACCC